MARNLRSVRTFAAIGVLGLLLAALLPGAPGSVLPPEDAGPTQRSFCTAQPGYRFEFPKDHFSHPCYQTEWWYFTGNVSTAQGRRFGFQLTFFREGLARVYANPSRWNATDLYLAHFAISDLSAGRFFFSQATRRAGPGLAGVDAEKGRIWNGLWQAELRDVSKPVDSGNAAGGDWGLQAAAGNHSINFRLVSRKAPVIQGRNGISQKAEGAGNASHYYSLTRLETAGDLRIGGQTYSVSGWAWMDHEFSTSQLDAQQTGWDWISMQMDDGTEWMLYQLRRKDGTRDAHSAGSFVDRQGEVTQLSSEDFSMTPLAQWTSPHSGAKYPIRWRIKVPSRGLELEISTEMPDQELDARESTGTVYWEGSVRAAGQQKGRPAEGRGYLEMTGYAGPLPSSLYSGGSGR